jgi:tRNA(Ile)-lysidine synthase
MVLDRVRKTIDHYHLLNPGDQLVVGVSGGVDSMVLLHLLYSLCQEFSLSLIVAHVNHGLRLKEAEEEAALVQRESDRLGLPFEYGHFNVKEFQKAGGYSLQDGARRIRFHFFNSLLKKYGANKIALGQNADDQVETVLLRLIRGAGLKGLKGILPIREGRIIRPLLEVWREEIESLAKEKAIPYLLDSSNLKGLYLRNRVRLHLIPLIGKEYQPGFKEAILRTSAILRGEDDYLERGADEAYRRIVRETKEGLFFHFPDYQSLHEAIQPRVVRMMLRRINGEDRLVENEEDAEAHLVFKKLQHSPPSFLFDFAQGILIEKRYDEVFLGKGRIRVVPPFEVEVLAPGRTFIEQIGKEVAIEETRRDEKLQYLNEPSTTAFLDYQRLQFPLTIRNFRPGDRFVPLGAGGSQKLKEFFIDHKIPRFERPKIPLLLSGEKITWVAGYRIDERFKVTDRTEKVLKVMIM